ncbi:fatty acid desaturase [Pleurocapsa sp. PCC 7319]|uniref:fatty acid desaturase family protein n=1 Tax=Pleurocapsa sp. PCC 7319 TaxID=118161 RepID=UPI000347FC3D|nr:fatty acid desaturase [Pleurocapsa sp. PCC 7319]
MTIATPTSVNLRTYVSKQKAFWNEIAITYTFLGYVGGIALLFLTNTWLNIVGVVLLTHSLIYSAYLSHEFMHGTIFKDRRRNVIFGQLMVWLNGGCYYGLQALTLQHIAHHIDRVDVFTFDIPAAIQKLSTPVRKIIFALEWCYFPIVSFWSRWRAIWKNWQKPEQTQRITCILAIRLTAFILIGIISFKALLLYFLSYVGMITVLRWIDAFQHTYEAFPVGTQLPKRDRDHEQLHTYSNLISRRYPWLNLLVLNFGYHNAHHAVMKCPWHSIPELDNELAQDKNVNYISLSQQLVNFHRYRVSRLISGQGDTNGEMGNRNYEQFFGAVDVSFITLY